MKFLMQLQLPLLNRTNDLWSVLLVMFLFSYHAKGQLVFESEVLFDDSLHLNLIGYALADFDGDTYPDLMTCSNESGTISFSTNINGSGFYSYQKVITDKVGEVNSIYAGDFDGDSDMDLVVATSTNHQVLLLKNDGEANFSDTIILAESHIWPRIIIADLDSDNDIDIVTWQNNKLYWFENIDGQANFNEVTEIPLGLLFNSDLIVEDVDEDGFQDLIVFNGLEITLFSGASGMWDTPIFLAEAEDNFGKGAVGDLNGDGKKDIAFTSQNDKKLYVIYNINGFNFESPVKEYTSQYMKEISINDIDGDGINDIVAGGDGYLFWLKNDNEGNFERQNLYCYKDDLNTLDVQDINNDGLLDVIAGYIYSENNITAHKQTEDGFEREIDIYKTLEATGNMNCQDVNGDGLLDIMLRMQSPARLAIIHQNSTGGYDHPEIVYLQPNTSVSAYYKFIDMDNDDDLDIIFSGSEMGWIENIDNIEYSAAKLVDIDLINPNYLLHTDFNNNGFNDFIIYNDNRLVALENTNGIFTQQTVLDTFESYLGQVFLGDVDGDLDLDLIHSPYEGDIFWRENLDGNFKFGPKQFIMYVETNYIHSIEDFDMDGDIDLIFSEKTNKGIFTLKNNDSFSNNVQAVELTGGKSHTILLSDLDLDGDTDMFYKVINSSKHKLGWYENIQDGQFGPEQVIDEDLPNGGAIATCIQAPGEAPDIVTHNNRTLRYYKNRGRGQNEIYGKVLFDLNADSCATSESPIRDQYIEMDFDGALLGQLSTFDGNYQFFTDPGEAKLSIENIPPNLSAYPSMMAYQLLSIDSIINDDFCLISNNAVNDLSISLYPVNEPRPGFLHRILVVFRNQGTSVIDGSIEMTFDSEKIDSIYSSEAGVEINDPFIKVEFEDFHPFQSRQFVLSMKIKPPPDVNNIDILTTTATIFPLENDITIENNTSVFEEALVGSYDPNDIRVLEGDTISLLQAQEYLHYIIRFQNTGTASAINVNIENQLDEKLDWSTFKLESMSHEGKVMVENRSDLNFIFDYINLPDSTTNEAESHGYIAYKIKPNNDVILGDLIENVADIYFDFNLPITTNTAQTIIYEEELTTENKIHEQTLISPNPISNTIRVSDHNEFRTYMILTANGELAQSGVMTEIIAIDQLSNGLYFIKLFDKNDRFSIHKIVIAN